MNKKYIVSRVAAVFFSVTTVVLFFLSQGGALFMMVSIETAITLVLANFCLLVVSLVIFAWQRARKDIDAQQESRVFDTLAVHDSSAETSKVKQKP